MVLRSVAPTLQSAERVGVGESNVYFQASSACLAVGSRGHGDARCVAILGGHFELWSWDQACPFPGVARDLSHPIGSVRLLLGAPARFLGRAQGHHRE